MGTPALLGRRSRWDRIHALAQGGGAAGAHRSDGVGLPRGALAGQYWVLFEVEMFDELTPMNGDLPIWL